MRTAWLLMIAAAVTAPTTVNAQVRAWSLAIFQADVTPPIGHPCMGGGIRPVTKIDDPLFANGFVLIGEGKPVVVVAVDWCEIRNDAYERWREVLAEAAGTDRDRVLVSTLHQHDAPIADLQAQRLLEAAKAKGSICDLAFHEKTVQRVAQALRESLKSPQRVTHVGVGEAKVDKVASNRRYRGADGTPRFDRMSASRSEAIRAAEEGTIDPWLKTLSFWDGDRAVLALSAYATHPMSYYGQGAVSADFVGMARKRRQADTPKVAQLYLSGCSGNVTAGKYNDGSPDNRAILADRVYQAMNSAWVNTKKAPLENVAFRSTALRLEPREGPGFTVNDLKAGVAKDQKPFNQCLAALGLSWRLRADAGATINVPALHLGPAILVLMPAEAYVEYQLLAQKTRPDAFVVVIGYGECAPGYIPTEQHIRENDGNLSDWNWVAPGAEPRIAEALKRVMAKTQP
jgi:hypothetical protein